MHYCTCKGPLTAENRPLALQGRKTTHYREWIHDRFRDTRSPTVENTVTNYKDTLPLITGSTGAHALSLQEYLLCTVLHLRPLGTGTPPVCTVAHSRTYIGWKKNPKRKWFICMYNGSLAHMCVLADRFLCVLVHTWWPLRARTPLVFTVAHTALSMLYIFYIYFKMSFRYAPNFSQIFLIFKYFWYILKFLSGMLRIFLKIFSDC